MKNTSAISLDLGLLLIRLMLGAVFLYHGAQKLFGMFDGPGLEGFTGYIEALELPMPKIAAVCAALAEFGGGVALVTGMFLRPVIATTVFTMLVAAFVAHSGVYAEMEYALTLALVTAGIFFTGAGRLALPTPPIRLPKRRSRDDD